MNILSFSPYAGIWQHAYPEAVALEPLLEANHKLTYLYCDGIFSKHCICMSAQGIEFNAPHNKKEEICKQCKIKRNILKNNFDFHYIAIDSLVNYEDINEVEKICNNLNKSELENLTIASLPIGKIATYEIIIESKKDNINFNEDEWEHYKMNLFNVLITYKVINKLFEQNTFDIVTSYDSAYATNNLVRQYTQQRKIEFYYLIAGYNWHNRLQKMVICKDRPLVFDNAVTEGWNKFKHCFIPKEKVIEITKHFLYIINSSLIFNYSSSLKKNVNIREYFEIPKKSKIILATLSSVDERFAATIVGHRYQNGGILFQSQLDWIDWLISYFSTRQDVTLIIRGHPRDFPNTRYPTMSDNAKKLMSKFENLPSNIKVNSPSDQLSIYNIAKEADVLLNAQSSSALDFLILGTPVVVFDEIVLTFPIELFYYGGATKNGYITAINQALSDGKKYSNILNAYKWLNIRMNLAEFDLSEAVNLTEIGSQNIFEKIIKKIKYAFLRKRNITKRSKLKDANTIISLFENKYTSKLDLQKECQETNEADFLKQKAIIRENVYELLQILYKKENIPESFNILFENGL